MVVVTEPRNEWETENDTVQLHVVAADDRGIRDLVVEVNGKAIDLAPGRGIQLAGGEESQSRKRLEIREKLTLDYGSNRIVVSATDIEGQVSKEILSVRRKRRVGRIWAAVIGINNYRNTRNLKYAVNDARAFRAYLEEHIGVPRENLFMLTDEQATRMRIQNLLGTRLKRTAGKNDTVIIFYAGHGAVETDPSDPDGDGFEKYLLPYDARLDDLYSTAIAMEEIKRIFRRIASERLILIADTCYSGASGGRTLLTSKTRANLSNAYMERVISGKGRVILSACAANEISKEDDRLQHGIFSYYVLKGLKGDADRDGDAFITVSELFAYLSTRVPQASDQDQHPVRKGETEGVFIIGRAK
jgi:uncharacterized caspase-like protein